MKKLSFLFFALGLILSACGAAATQPVLPVQTSTPTLPPTLTQTPIPPTSTITPLPTIPTFTPTFDVSTIVTVTPAEKAECPLVVSVPNPDFSFLAIPSSWDISERIKSYNNLREEITNFLNINGIVPLISYLDLTNKRYFLQDVTNDGVSEFMFASAIFGCNNGKYKILLWFDPNVTGGTPTIEQIHDGNHNGIPEVIINTNTGNHGGRWYRIYEWLGNSFRSVLHEFFTNADGEWEFQDLNNDGIQELIVTEGVEASPLSTQIQSRNAYRYYQWNGTIYAQYYYQFDYPIYRFQAIQDGDFEVTQRQYDQALLLYQDAIFSKKLGWWSPAQYEFMKNKYYNSNVTLPPPPIEDPAEYPRLAAYAYYRILLLHLAQGQESEAALTYQTLQKTFGKDPYAAPYVEMATAFWEAYQSTQRMYDGCAEAIQFAIEHPEILVPLGSDYHGSQSKIYKPEDVCPFR